MPTEAQRGGGSGVRRRGRKKGVVNASVPSPQAAGDAKIPMPTQAEVDAVALEITTILTVAGGTDSAAAAALRFHAKDKHDFESSGFTSFDSAQKTIKDSNELIALGKKDPSELTNKELERFNALMKEHPGEVIFAERVATGLGPDGTLKFFAGAVDLENWEHKGDANTRESREARMALLGTLEKELGATLATASRSGTDAMESWKDRVIALGGQDVGSDKGASQTRVYGFQAMSNLMRHGKYEGDFLNDYMLNEGLSREMVRDIHEDNPKDPKETLLRAGNSVGFLEEARYQALVTDKDDPTWDAKWMYHGFGSIVNFAPGVGDLAQRGIDAVAYEWQTQEQSRIDAIHQRDNKDVFTGREQQLQALADEWAKANPNHTNTRYTLTEEINGAAYNGNDRAKGLAGGG